MWPFNTGTTERKRGTQKGGEFKPQMDTDGHEFIGLCSARPHPVPLPQERGTRDVEGGALLVVEFGRVTDGLHEGQRATGWNRVDDADVVVHMVYFWGRLLRDGKAFRGKVWYQKVPRIWRVKTLRSQREKFKITINGHEC